MIPFLNALIYQWYQICIYAHMYLDIGLGLHRKTFGHLIVDTSKQPLNVLLEFLTVTPFFVPLSLNLIT